MCCAAVERVCYIQNTASRPSAAVERVCVLQQRHDNSSESVPALSRLRLWQHGAALEAGALRGLLCPSVLPTPEHSGSCRGACALSRAPSLQGPVASIFHALHSLQLCKPLFSDRPRKCSRLSRALLLTHTVQAVNVQLWQPSLMANYSLPIDYAGAEASTVLARMRLDGLDRTPLPFEERYVQAWRGTPKPDMDLVTLINVFKVRCTFVTRWKHRCRARGVLPRCGLQSSEDIIWGSASFYKKRFPFMANFSPTGHAFL